MKASMQLQKQSQMWPNNPTNSTTATTKLKNRRASLHIRHLHGRLMALVTATQNVILNEISRNQCVGYVLGTGDDGCDGNT